ncbi:MAG: hypothetical protein GY755_17145 [Chloroflexi bacterium]|nr:hypothetical protein [Chloroflexota bacterium]
MHQRQNHKIGWMIKKGSIKKNNRITEIIAISILMLLISACSLSRGEATSQEAPDTRNCNCQSLDITKIMLRPPDWEYDFENGWNAEYGKGDLSQRNTQALAWRYSQMQTSSAGEVMPDPKNANNSVMRFLWQRGKGQQYDTNTQKKAHLYGAFGEHNIQKEVWSLDLYFPSAEMPSDKEPEILIQWHGVPDNCELPRNPPIALANQQDRLSVTWRCDQKNCTPWGFKRWDAGWKDLGETPKDQWVNFVFAIQWDPFGCGVLEIWQDGNRILDEKEIPLGFNDTLGAYLGFGIYKYTLTSESQYRTIYFDNVKQWIVP